MAKLTVGRPIQEIRLRNWPAGRQAALRLMVSRLEEVALASLASQTLKNTKRKFNANIPNIIEFDVKAGFRQFEVSFPIPPGLGGAGRGLTPHPDRQLLFYEIEHSTSAAFTDSTIVNSPQNHLIISGAGLGETRFFRARVVNTKQEAGPYTATISSTAAGGRIIQTAIPSANDRLVTDFTTWKTITRKTYTPANGKVMLMAHLAVGGLQSDVTNNQGVTYRGGPAHVQFRWTRDIGDGNGDKEIGDGLRCVMSAVPGYTGTVFGKAPEAFGTFMTSFLDLGDTATVFKLQARKRANSRWKGGDGSGALTISDPMIFVRNGQILEVIEEF